jgi:hypothetical protein
MHLPPTTGVDMKLLGSIVTSCMLRPVIVPVM